MIDLGKLPSSYTNIAMDSWIRNHHFHTLRGYYLGVRAPLSKWVIPPVIDGISPTIYIYIYMYVYIYMGLYGLSVYIIYTYDMIYVYIYIWIIHHLLSGMHIQV